MEWSNLPEEFKTMIIDNVKSIKKNKVRFIIKDREIIKKRQKGPRM